MNITIKSSEYLISVFKLLIFFLVNIFLIASRAGKLLRFRDL